MGVGFMGGEPRGRLVFTVTQGRGMGSNRSSCGKKKTSRSATPATANRQLHHGLQALVDELGLLHTLDAPTTGGGIFFINHQQGHCQVD